MPWYLTVALVVSGAGLLAFGWRRFSRYAAERDWIYHEKHNPRPEGLSSLGLLEEIYQPAIEHMVQEIAEERARGSQDGQGEGDR